MGWGRTEIDKLMYIIQLDDLIEVGTTMTGGVMIYNRICVTSNEDKNSRGIGGEWLTRQYLRSHEADAFLRMEKHAESSSGMDVVVAGVRGLTKVLEIDNALIRTVRDHYLIGRGLDVSVHVSTMQHSNRGEYFDEQADEPYLIVTLNGGASGTSIRRS